MSKPTLYNALAEAFVAEGVDTQFVLMGDGNMHWSTALAAMQGIATVHVRHEHCAVAAAMSYHLATGKVAAASVTCGPGFTQVMTALPAAARARIPLVVFAGEAPINAKFYNQHIDQAPFAVAAGAHYIAAHSMGRMMEHVREAFHIARLDRKPVILGVPYDLQKAAWEGKPAYQPSSDFLPDGGRPQPDPAQLAKVVERLRAARRPIVLAGRGVPRAGAKAAVAAMADAAGALLATTLPVRGLFDDSPWSLGITGGYGSTLSREMFASADLVVVVGASLSYYTSDGGHLFPDATVIQIDDAPRGLKDGMMAAKLFVRADAKATCEAITAALGKGGGTAASIRTPELARRIATEAADDAPFDIAPSLLDPRAVIRELDSVIPPDWDIVSGSGHQAYFIPHMRGRSHERFTTIREFGAIGNGLSYALGVAAARRQGRGGKLVLIEGDGGLLMHIQELETLKRHGYRMLIVTNNDGAYGSEIHKLRADRVDDRGAIFGRPDFAGIARGFGLRGATITEPGRMQALFTAFAAQGDAEVWDVHISDQVTAPSMRNTVKRGHGKM